MLVASLLTLATEAILIWLLKDWTSGAGWLIVFVPIVIPAGIVWRLRFKRGHITGIVTIVVLFAMGVGGVFFPPLGSFAAGVAALVGAGIGVVLPTGRDLNQFSPPLGARET
jgi:hypothetical protein